LEDTNNSGAPQIEGSLAHYFYLMSRDQLRFDAAYYDSVVVLNETIAWYDSAYSPESLEAEIAAGDAVEAVAADSTFDLAPFATAGVLDCVVVVFRGTSHIVRCDSALVRLHSGAIGALNSISIAPLPLISQHDGQIYSVVGTQAIWITSQGSRVCWTDYPNPPSSGALSCDDSTCAPWAVYAECEATSGPDSTNITCPVQCTSLEAFRQGIVHEIGHSLMGNFFDFWTQHLYSANNWCIMHSNGRGNIMHAYERLKLGWIEPIVVTPGQDVTITLYDSVTRNTGAWQTGVNDSTYVKILPNPADTTQYFLLENRRFSTVYTEPWVGSTTFTGVGQPGRGLLISHINTDGVMDLVSELCSTGLRQRVTVEPAYGLFDGDHEPNPQHGRSRITGNVGQLDVAHADDAFYPGKNNTFSPYTCPNTDLYDASDTLQAVHSGLAVLNIRGGPDSSLVFEVRWNQPSERTAGNVTWDGQVILTDDFTVSAGDTLETNGNPVVLAARTPRTPGEGVDSTRVELVVEQGGKLDIVVNFDDVGPTFASARDTSAYLLGPRPDGSLRFTCVVSNSPTLLDTTVVTSNPVGTSDWYGIRLPGLTALGINAGTVKHARSAIAMETNTFVNPSRFEGSHRLALVDNYNKLSFDRDVLVPLDSVFVLFSGFTLGFAADRDEGHLTGLGRLPNKSELIVQGSVDFRGNNYYDRVIIRSDDPDGTDAEKKGDWGSMVLLPFPPDSNCADTRELDFTLFRDAVHGIVPVDTCFMKMNWPLFENNDSSDIYLDRDVVIREGIQVDLRAPTRFLVKAGSSAVDLTGGEPGKVDFIVRGKFIGRRPGVVAPTEWIWFESTDKDSLNGDDYGGLVFDWTSAGSVLEDADIGWAVNPVFLYYPDSLTTIQGCRIHHFNDKGVWVYGTMGVGAVIETCTIERGVGLSGGGPNLVGGTLVRLDYTDDLRFERNKLDLTGISHPQSTAALDAYFGKIHCLTSSGQTDSLIVRKNWVIGPGAAQQGGRRGVRAFWLCGSTSRRILLDENYVQDFRTAAFEFNQSSDTQVNCNTTLGNRRVVDLYRDASATGPPVRFKSNWLEVKTGIDEVLRTDDNVKTRLGPHQSNLGDNGLLVERTSANFIRENDPNAGDKLDARDSYWYLFTAPSGPEELISDPLDSFEITNRIVPSAIDVLYGPFYTDDTNPLYCLADTVPTGGAAAMPIRQPTIGHAEGRGVEERQGMAVAARVVPEETFLAVRGGGTSVSAATFEIGVAAADAGRFVLDVFDVRGRRVARLVDGPVDAGTHHVSWRDGTASGVYFARLKGDSIVKTKKLVVLR
jgi:hypothetical protein